MRCARCGREFNIRDGRCPYCGTSVRQQGNPGNNQQSNAGYNQPYGQGYNRQNNPGYNQPYGQGYNRQNNPGYNQPYGQGYNRQGNPGYNQPYGQGYNRQGNPGYNRPYGQGYNGQNYPGYPARTSSQKIAAFFRRNNLFTLIGFFASILYALICLIVFIAAIVQSSKYAGINSLLSMVGVSKPNSHLLPFLLSTLFVGAPAVVFSILGMRQTRRTGQPGYKLALTGIITSGSAFLLFILILIIF